MNISGIGQTQSAYTAPATTGGPALSESSVKKPDARAEFLKWAQMSPEERMRANFLAGMGLDDAKVAAMSEDERRKVEEKIREMIEQKITQGDQKPGQLVDKKV